MRVSQTYNNLARAKTDHDLIGRYDLPVYRTGADIFENYVSNYKGNGIYRAGYKKVYLFQDCVYAEFKFNKQQQYLCVFYAGIIRFLSFDVDGNFGWVLNSGSTPLEVVNPYTLDECRGLQYSQKNDAMIFTLDGFEPHKLIRVAADDFDFTPFARKNDPFALTYDATKVITAITKAVNAQVSAAAHGYSVDDMVKFASIGGMTELNDWTARVTEVVDAGNYKIDIDTTDFTTYTSAGTSAKVATGDYPASCLFNKGRLYYAATTDKITSVFYSVAGLFYDHTRTPVDAASAGEHELTEISQKIEWLHAGENSLLAGASDGIVPINGGAVGKAITAETIEGNKSSVTPCNSTYPLSKDGYVFYVDTSARTLQYFDYDLLKESFQSKDANLTAFDITKGGLSKIRHKKDKNDLVFALAGDKLLSSNMMIDENIIGWHEHPTNGTFKDIAVMTDNNGVPKLITLTQRNGGFHIEIQAEYVEFSKRDDFFVDGDAVGEDITALEAAKISDNTAYLVKTSEELKECNYLDNSLIYNNLQDNSITYTGDDDSGTIVDTDGVFVSGDVGKEIVYKTETGYESGRFEITGYTDANTVDVNVLQIPTATTYTDWYLTFDTVSGLTDYNGTTVGVVADGGYLADFAVSSGSIDLGKQVTHIVLGYKYRGIIKTFPLGFQSGAENTQTSVKTVFEVGLRAVATAGGKMGSSLYDLDPIQDLTQGMINYLPPKLIDGSKYIPYLDEPDEDKCLYIVQDKPLPMTIAAIIVNAEYAVRQ